MSREETTWGYVCRCEDGEQYTSSGIEDVTIVARSLCLSSYLENGKTLGKSVSIIKCVLWFSLQHLF
jgi:hypothetical protein